MFPQRCSPIAKLHIYQSQEFSGLKRWHNRTVNTSVLCKYSWFIILMTTQTTQGKQHKTMECATQTPIFMINISVSKQGQCFYECVNIENPFKCNDMLESHQSFLMFHNSLDYLEYIAHWAQYVIENTYTKNICICFYREMKTLHKQITFRAKQS